MQKKLRVAVIFGGRSGEHEVSLVSAKSVMAALNTKKYEIIPVGITKKGKWLCGKNALKCFKKGSYGGLFEAGFCPNSSSNFLIFKNGRVISRQKIDVAFPVLHGPYGEDGTFQGLMEMNGIPYVGCGVFASAVCMDKFMSKMIFKSCGLPQADFVHFTRREIKSDFGRVQKMILKTIGLPCFVKPSILGSSVGISKVKKIATLKKALLAAASYDSSVLVEKAINAREIECAVLGNDEPAASLPGEIVPSSEFYDYSAKYVDNSSVLIIPAKLSSKEIRQVQALSKAAYRAVGASGMARVDFLMDKKTGEFYLNELNTIPGFTSISMYPKLWKASGIPYSKLLDKLVNLALDKFKEKQKNKISFDGGDWYNK